MTLLVLCRTSIVIVYIIIIQSGYICHPSCTHVPNFVSLNTSSCAFLIRTTNTQHNENQQAEYRSEHPNQQRNQKWQHRREVVSVLVVQT